MLEDGVKYYHVRTVQDSETLAYVTARSHNVTNKQELIFFSSLKRESHLPPLLLRHHVPSCPASCPAPLAVAAGLPGPQGELPAQYEPGNAQVAPCGHPERGRPGHHGQADHVGAVAPGFGEGVEGAANQEGLWDKDRTGTI